MKKALIIYLSRKGTTKYFAHNIGNFLKQKSIDCTVLSMHDVTPEIINDFDIILFGCWTHGLFFFLQHPEKQWVKFTENLPAMNDKSVGLFTTYKIATGTMFSKMKKALNGKINNINITLKSKSEELNEQHMSLLESLIK